LSSISAPLPQSSLVIRRSPMIGNIPPFGSIALFRLHCNAISLRCLEARKREIDADLKAQQGDMEIAIHPNLPDLYRRKVARLQQVLDDEAARPQLVEIIRSLIDRIEGHPSKERGNCEVLIVGALAPAWHR
jgi:hypothetical protein